jgi:23S rRNA (uridine2552-2'-O)-methyltransferase
MERARASSGGKRRLSKPRKRPQVDPAKTALGAAPEKRGLAKSAAAPPAAGAGGGQRELSVSLKTARKRKLSSQLWLQRQLNDPYVARAKAEGYRSRAAYKLLELDAKFSLLRDGARVVDLGAAPGGWSQVAVKKGAARVLGVDYLPVAPIPGAESLELDFLDAEAPARLKAALGGGADLVLSDMAAPTTGHRATDHLRVVALAEAALDFATDVLAPGGAFVCKVFQGGSAGELLRKLKENFAAVRHAKPKASRSESAEIYVVASGFRGRPQ